MKIAVIGTGYVGLITGACFAELGNEVSCIDVDQDKIGSLRKGILPIYEPGLETMVVSNMKEGRLRFFTSLQESQSQPDIIFIAVGTPSDKDGFADMQYVLAAACHIGEYIKDYCVIVDKSTVPVGMADCVNNTIQDKLKKRDVIIEFDIVSNPEFLREGAAIEDFMRPDRIIIGLSSLKAKDIMLELYTPILRHPEKIYFMSIKDAEMTKYVANAMLATKVSFMNEMAVICEEMGVDIENVRIGIGSDSRIGNAFIYAGCGYGGSCFPKDVKALIKIAESHGVDPCLLRSVEERNFLQKHILPHKIKALFGEDLSSVTVGVWGLSFKPGTDDMREASSLILLESLIQRGATVLAYDPVAMPVARNILPSQWFNAGSLYLVDHLYDAVRDADVLVLVTEWKLFCYPDFSKMKNLMRRHIILDGRNQYDPKQIRDAGFQYYGIGRQGSQPRPYDISERAEVITPEK